MTAPHISAHHIAAYRVPCPTCGEWAQLRAAHVEQRPARAIGFSCRNQTDSAHAVPSSGELRRVVEAWVEPAGARAC